MSKLIEINKFRHRFLRMERIGGRRKNKRRERILGTRGGARNAVCAAKKCLLQPGRIKSREESIFKKEDVDRMFTE